MIRIDELSGGTGREKAGRRGGGGEVSIACRGWLYLLLVRRGGIIDDSLEAGREFTLEASRRRRPGSFRGTYMRMLRECEHVPAHMCTAVLLLLLLSVVAHLLYHTTSSGCVQCLVGFFIFTSPTTAHSCASVCPTAVYNIAQDTCQVQTNFRPGFLQNMESRDKEKCFFFSRFRREGCTDASLVAFSAPSPLSRNPGFENRPRGCVVLRKFAYTAHPAEQSREQKSRKHDISCTSGTCVQYACRAPMVAVYDMVRTAVPGTW